MRYMEKKILQMIFKTQDGSAMTLSLGDLKENLTESEVSTVMDEIVAKRLFASNKGAVAAKDKARFVTQTVEEIAI